MTPGIELRALDGIDECREATRFQESIWGEGFSERVPASLLHVLPRIGSVAIGAWRESRMVGLVFGVTGVEGGRIVHWSDILGVAHEVRDQGVGRRLKEAQRVAARSAGATVMYWTFDPLEARNGWFNVARLGAEAREYRVDMYGEPNSPLHAGIGTDRLVARWDLNPSGPQDARDPSRDDVAHAVLLDASKEAPAPIVRSISRGAAVRRIDVPADIQAIKRSDPGLASAWRRAVRDAMQSAFADGLHLRGADRIDGGLGYIFRRPRVDTNSDSFDLPA